MAFDPRKLRDQRRRKGVSLAALAERIGISSAHLHRLELGKRRLSVDAMLTYCQELGLDPGILFSQYHRVPVTGIIDAVNEIKPLPPDSEATTWVPPIAGDMDSIAAVRWEPSGNIERMFGHIIVYRRHSDGIPESAWERRCVLMRTDGTQRIGWPIRNGNATHIDNPEGRAEFNVSLRWASPIMAVISPHLIEDIQASLDQPSLDL